MCAVQFLHSCAWYMLCSSQNGTDAFLFYSWIAAGLWKLLTLVLLHVWLKSSWFVKIQPVLHRSEWRLGGHGRCPGWAGHSHCQRSDPGTPTVHHSTTQWPWSKYVHATVNRAYTQNELTPQIDYIMYKLLIFQICSTSLPVYHSQTRIPQSPRDQWNVIKHVTERRQRW